MSPGDALTGLTVISGASAMGMPFVVHGGRFGRVTRRVAVYSPDAHKFTAFALSAIEGTCTERAPAVAAGTGAISCVSPALAFSKTNIMLAWAFRFVPVTSRSSPNLIAGSTAEAAGRIAARVGKGDAIATGPVSSFPRFNTGGAACTPPAGWISTTDAMYAMVGRYRACIAVHILESSSELRNTGDSLMSST